MRPFPVLALAAVTLASACTARLVATGRVQGQGAPPPSGSPATRPVEPPPVVVPVVVRPSPPPRVTSPLEIAGTPVVRVGVNFEDQGAGGDADYNDAVLCFAGAFKVDRATVISTEAQEVIATTSSISACRHRVRVQVVHPDGRVEAPAEFDSASGQRVALRFELGSRLDVTMRTVSGGCDPTERSMTEPAWAQVLLDRCNTTGR